MVCWLDLGCSDGAGGEGDTLRWHNYSENRECTETPYIPIQRCVQSLYHTTLIDAYLGTADSAAVVPMAVSPFSSATSAGTMVPSLFNFTGGRRRLASAATAARRVTSNRDPSAAAVESHSGRGCWEL